MDESKPILNQFVFHGVVIERNTETVSLRISPGVVVEVKTADIQELEEATDEVSRRAYVRVQLKEDAEFRATFQPKLARLAAAGSGVPFGVGGQLGQLGQPARMRMLPVGTNQWFDQPEGAGLGSGEPWATIGPAPGRTTRVPGATRSNVLLFGWVDDDSGYETYWD
jgi:hypothetical protein